MVLVVLVGDRTVVVGGREFGVDFQGPRVVGHGPIVLARHVVGDAAVDQRLDMVRLQQQRVGKPRDSGFVLSLVKQFGSLIVTGRGSLRICGCWREYWPQQADE